MIYIFGAAFDPPHIGHSAIVRTLLVHHNPDQVILLPSSDRDDKQYHVSDEHRLALLRIFQSEIGDSRVILDDYFLTEWEGEMITRDVDRYARGKYGEDIIHVFGTDTISSMSLWDEEGYAAKKIQKLFVPRFGHREEGCATKGSHTPECDHPTESVRHMSGVRATRKEKGIPHGDSIASYLAMTEQEGIENFEFFTHSHIPTVSSREVRALIPEYTTLKALFEENPKFIIPGLSKQISQYILEERLYRQALPQKPKVLVHVCCGPDVIMPILKLRDEYDVVCFWYDPNIQPKSEHDKRYDAFVKVCELENIPYIKGAYDVKNFFTRIRGVEHTPEKGEKCTYCYDMRMYVAAKLASRLKISYYTSSLNTSPKKDLEKLFIMGHKYAEKYQIEFLDIPFRKRGGFEESVAYTHEHDIYRQNYCGCIYSIRDGGESDMKQKMVG